MRIGGEAPRRRAHSALGVAPFALATIVKTRLAAALVGAAWGAVEWLSAA
jgi:hypothetical protein